MQLLDLPNELLHTLYTYLEPKEYFRLSSTCQRLYTLREPCQFAVENITYFPDRAPRHIIDAFHPPAPERFAEWIFEKRVVHLCHLLVQRKSIPPLYLDRCLVHAATYGFLDLCKELVAMGANTNTSDYYHHTALQGAAAHGHMDVCKYGYYMDLDPCARKESCFEVFQFLLNNGADPHQEDHEGRNMLHWTSYAGSIEHCRILVAHGTDVNHVSNDSFTPIFWACMLGHTEMFKFLLDNNAQVDVATEEGETPLVVANYNYQMEIFEMLMTLGVDIGGSHCMVGTNLCICAQRGDTDWCRVLIERGADVNTRGYYGHTALMEAAGYPSIETCQLLLETGADVNMQDELGYSAMHSAAEHGSLPLLLLLLKHGARLDLKTDGGKTPKDIAKGNVLDWFNSHHETEESALFKVQKMSLNVSTIQFDT
ncbi:ankyrin repeat-containing domain protein [Gorgonomyces haynaldii]|nr:ankyrin repeat-containing domain protein [Gorgonomyces haynaldii]